MLHAARVLADRHPPLDVLAAERAVLVAGRAVPEEVPARIDERVHRVGVAARAAAARSDRPCSTNRSCRASGDSPPGRKSTSSGSSTGSWSSGTGDLAALRAVHDRDRRAPVALTRDQPVAQPVVDGAARPALLPRATRRPSRSTRASARRRTGRSCTITPSCVERLGHRRRVQLLALGLDHDPDRQAVLAGELEVALVVRRHAP